MTEIVLLLLLIVLVGDLVGNWKTRTTRREQILRMRR